MCKTLCLDLTALSAIYAQDASFLANAARFSANMPCFVAALSAERHCVATFSADAAKLHKVELYARDLVHRAAWKQDSWTRSPACFATLYNRYKDLAQCRGRNRPYHRSTHGSTRKGLATANPFLVAPRGIERIPLNSLKFSLIPEYKRVKWRLKKPSWH